jgi:PAS domain S-box-containing protein
MNADERIAPDKLPKKPARGAASQAFKEMTSLELLKQETAERERAEQARRESEERYRALVKHSSDAIFIFDPKTGNLLEANDQFLKMLGYREEDIAQLKLRDIVFFGDKTLRYEIQKALESGQEVFGLRQYKRADGSFLDVEVGATLINYSSEQVVMVNMRDVTERTRAERALRSLKEGLELRVAERTTELQDANEKLRLAAAKGKRVEEMLRKGAERYRDLFQNPPIGIYRTNPHGLILMANHAMVRMLGFNSFTDITTNDIEEDDYEPTYLRADFRKRLEQEGRVRGYEATWKRPDGTDIFVSENARAIKSEDGAVLYYEGTVEDITEKKEAEEKIERYQEELRSLASELSLAEERERRRIANILHDDIGQLLAVARIKLWSLLEATTSDDLKAQVNDARHHVEEAINRTRLLTSELSPPILYELGIEAALEWLGERMQKQHGFEFTFDGGIEHEPLDEEVRIFLFTCVRELLVNIAKHANARNVRVSIKKSGDDVVVGVEDDGVGFPAAKTDWGSGGFGLFSIRERLRHLGGHIHIDSAPGSGTRVVLSVPSRVRTKNRKDTIT